MTIASYIQQRSNGEGRENDWFIIGDMNIQSCKELGEISPEQFVSLNDECRDTATSPNSDRPYDHVMYRPDLTRTVDTQYDMAARDLVELVRHRWSVIGSGPYPGDPYMSKIFPNISATTIRATSGSTTVQTMIDIISALKAESVFS